MPVAFDRLPLLSLSLAGGALLAGEIDAATGLLAVAGVVQLAAWGLVALFIAVYPANLNMAFNHISIGGIPDFWWVHAIRLPFQFVLIAWAYWNTDNTAEVTS